MSGRDLGHEPAGPVLDYGNCQYPGLTKREAFAMAAMQAEISAGSEYSISFILTELGLPPDTTYIIGVHWPAFVARNAAQCADALLAELAKDGAA